MSQYSHRYEFYYDVVLGGQYTFRIKELHAVYGPIIRINPHELHISDPMYYDTIYASGSKGERRNKWDWSAKLFLTPGSVIETVDHDLHRSRRGALNRFFSTASVRRLQFVIEERAQVLLERLRDFKNVEGEKGIVKTEYAFAAFTCGRFNASLRFTSPALRKYQTSSCNMRMDVAIIVWRQASLDPSFSTPFCMPA